MKAVRILAAIVSFAYGHPSNYLSVIGGNDPNSCETIGSAIVTVLGSSTPSFIVGGVSASPSFLDIQPDTACLDPPQVFLFNTETNSGIVLDSSCPVVVSGNTLDGRYTQVDSLYSLITYDISQQQQSTTEDQYGIFSWESSSDGNQYKVLITFSSLTTMESLILIPATYSIKSEVMAVAGASLAKAQNSAIFIGLQNTEYLSFLRVTPVETKEFISQDHKSNLGITAFFVDQLSILYFGGVVIDEGIDPENPQSTKRPIVGRINNADAGSLSDMTSQWASIITYAGSTLYVIEQFSMTSNPNRLLGLAMPRDASFSLTASSQLYIFSIKTQTAASCPQVVAMGLTVEHKFYSLIYFSKVKGEQYAIATMLSGDNIESVSSGALTSEGILQMKVPEFFECHSGSLVALHEGETFSLTTTSETMSFSSFSFALNRIGRICSPIAASKHCLYPRFDIADISQQDIAYLITADHIMRDTVYEASGDGINVDTLGKTYEEYFIENRYDLGQKSIVFQVGYSASDIMSSGTWSGKIQIDQASLQGTYVNAYCYAQCSNDLALANSETQVAIVIDFTQTPYEHEVQFSSLLASPLEEIASAEIVEKQADGTYSAISEALSAHVEFDFSTSKLILKEKAHLVDEEVPYTEFFLQVTSSCISSQSTLDLCTPAATADRSQTAIPFKIKLRDCVDQVVSLSDPSSPLSINVHKNQGVTTLFSSDTFISLFSLSDPSRCDLRKFTPVKDAGSGVFSEFTEDDEMYARLALDLGSTGMKTDVQTDFSAGVIRADFTFFIEGTTSSTEQGTQKNYREILLSVGCYTIPLIEGAVVEPAEASTTAGYHFEKGDSGLSSRIVVQRQEGSIISLQVDDFIKWSTPVQDCFASNIALVGAEGALKYLVAAPQIGLDLSSFAGYSQDRLLSKPFGFQTNPMSWNSTGHILPVLSIEQSVAHYSQVEVVGMTPQDPELKAYSTASIALEILICGFEEAKVSQDSLLLVHLQDMGAEPGQAVNYTAPLFSVEVPEDHLPYQAASDCPITEFTLAMDPDCFSPVSENLGLKDKISFDTTSGVVQISLDEPLLEVQLYLRARTWGLQSKTIPVQVEICGTLHFSTRDGDLRFNYNEGTKGVDMSEYFTENSENCIVNTYTYSKGQVTEPSYSEVFALTEKGRLIVTPPADLDYENEILNQVVISLGIDGQIYASFTLSIVIWRGPNLPPECPPLTNGQIVFSEIKAAPEMRGGDAQLFYESPEFIDPEGDEVKLKVVGPKFISWKISSNRFSVAWLPSLLTPEDEGLHTLKVTAYDEVSPEVFEFSIAISVEILSSSEQQPDQKEPDSSTDDASNSEDRSGVAIIKPTAPPGASFASQDQIAKMIEELLLLREAVVQNFQEEIEEEVEEKAPPPVEISVDEFTFDGLIKISFNQPLIIPPFARGSSVGSDQDAEEEGNAPQRRLVSLDEFDVAMELLSLKFLLKSSVNAADIHYFLRIESWEEEELIVRATFANPLLISTGQLNDEVEVEIIGKYYFISQATGDALTAGGLKKLIATVPPQLPPGLTEEQLRNQAKAGASGATVIMVIQIVSQVLMKGSLQKLLSLFFTLQFAKVMTVFEVNFPGNVLIYIQELRKLIDFEMLSPSFLLEIVSPGMKMEDLLGMIIPTFKESTPDGSTMTKNFESSGISSGNILATLVLPLVLIVGVGLLLIVGLLLVAIRLSPAKRLQVRKFIQGKAFKAILTGQLFYYTNGCVAFVAQAFTFKTDTTAAGTPSSEKASMMASFFLLLVFLLHPLAVSACIYLKQVEATRIKDNFQLFFDRVPLERSNGAQFFYAAFLLRRFLCIAVVAILPGTLQVTTTLLLSQIYIIYIGLFEPLKPRSDLRLELLNETLLLILFTHMVLFTDFISEVSTSFSIGYSFLGWLGILITLNLSLIMFQAGSNALRKYRLRKLRKIASRVPTSEVQQDSPLLKEAKPLPDQLSPAKPTPSEGRNLSSASPFLMKKLTEIREQEEPRKEVEAFESRKLVEAVPKSSKTKNKSKKKRKKSNAVPSAGAKEETDLGAFSEDQQAPKSALEKKTQHLRIGKLPSESMRASAARVNMAEDDLLEDPFGQTRERSATLYPARTKAKTKLFRLKTKELRGVYNQTEDSPDFRSLKKTRTSRREVSATFPGEMDGIYLDLSSIN